VKFKQETEFQDTEIGKIPRDWKVVKLGEVVEIWDKYRIPVKENERKPGPFPYCGANGIIDYIDGYTHDGEFVLLAEDGGFFGRFEKSAYIMRGKFWANNHVHVLKAIKGTIISEFLMHYLNFTDLTPFITGSTRPKLNQEAMKKIPIALPSLVEQMKIADILSTVDRAIEVVDADVARLEGLKRALMRELLTGRIRVREENGKTAFHREIEFQDTEIGKIPREWKVVYLSELFEFHRGLSYRKNNLSPTQTSIRFVTINDLKKEGGWKREGESAYLSEEFKDKIEKKHILKVGDLLIAITDMGKGFIIGAPLYINEDIRSQGETLVYSMDLVKLQPKKQVNALFYFYQLSWSKIREIMKSLARGTNVLHLDLNLAQRIKLVEPPLNEQVKIAEILSTVDRAIELYHEEKTRLDRLKQGLTDLLLTGRVRVMEE